LLQLLLSLFAVAAVDYAPLILDYAAAVLPHSGMSRFLISTALNSSVLPSVKTTLKHLGLRDPM
jgi:hypothetical protein